MFFWQCHHSQNQIIRNLMWAMFSVSGILAPKKERLMPPYAIAYILLMRTRILLTRVSCLRLILSCLTLSLSCLTLSLRWLTLTKFLLTPHPYKGPLPKHDCQGLDRGSRESEVCFSLSCAIWLSNKIIRQTARQRFKAYVTANKIRLNIVEL